MLNDEKAWITAESFCLFYDSVTKVPVQWVLNAAFTAFLVLEHFEA